MGNQNRTRRQNTQQIKIIFPISYSTCWQSHVRKPLQPPSWISQTNCIHWMRPITSTRRALIVNLSSRSQAQSLGHLFYVPGPADFPKPRANPNQKRDQYPGRSKKMHRKTKEHEKKDDDAEDCTQLRLRWCKVDASAIGWQRSGANHR